MLIPAISLHQPSASLIAIGAKPFETRSFPPTAKYIGKRIAIHAAMRPPTMRELVNLRDAVLLWGGPTDGKALDVLDAYVRHGIVDFLPRGMIVCTAVIDGAYQCGECTSPGHVAVTQFRGHLPYGRNLPTDIFGDYSPGRWAWLLKDVRPLATPLPVKGKQGWFSVEFPGEVAS